MHAFGTIRTWHRDEGWGVIDSPATPGGCWCHYSHLWHVETPKLGPDGIFEGRGGFVAAEEGQAVEFSYEAADQDGYTFRAVSAWPLDTWSPPIQHRRRRPAE